MTFNVGQKVVCVNDTPNHPGETAPIRAGRIYTISNIFADANGRPLVRLLEASPPAPYTEFKARRFRSIVSRSTEAEVAKLRKLLNPAPRMVDA